MGKMVYQRAHDWLFAKALPFWIDKGVDRQYGGFVESFTLDGVDSCLPYKRTRVTARQIYVFSHAAILGYDGALDVVKHGVDHLITKAWIGDGKGFARRVSRERGEVLDDTPDLYDYAFALFALSWAYKAAGDKAYIDWAHKTLDHIELLLAHPTGLGYWHDATKNGWRQQNPHMHILESALAASDASGDERFKALAINISDLFVSKFFDLERSVLPEFFDDNWRPAPAPDGTFFEPGHQFEWAWILNNCSKILGTDHSEYVRSLIRSAEQTGVDPETGTTYNRIDIFGNSLDRGSRTWPNTERIKAAAALYELDGVDPRPVFESSGGILLDRYLNRNPAGTWIDLYGQNGEPMSDAVPTSTLYHVVLAFAEMLRIGKVRGEFNNMDLNT